MADWLPSAEARLFWFVQTHRDLARLRKTLPRLRRVYSDSEALVVSDGDPDPEIEKVCREHSVGFALRPHLFGVESGGESVQQMLDAFLTTDADILIKIDPDTHIRRRLTRMPLPTDPSLFGSVQYSGDGSKRLVSIQGGCIIIPRLAARLLRNSFLLESPRLKPPAIEWAVNKLSLDRAASGLTSQDWTLGWACRELGVQCKSHPDVYSNYRPRLIDGVRKGRAAVSHPRFEIGHLRKPGFYEWFGPLLRAFFKKP